MSNSDRRNSSRQSQDIDDNLYYEEEPAYTLPRNGLTRAIVIGFVGGLVALAISIGIVVSNASLFNEGARLGNNMPIGVASSILKIQLASLGIDLIIAFIVGMFVGWVAVKRWWGFLAGLAVEVVVQVGIFLAQYIPSYPGIIASKGSNWILGVLIGIVIALFWIVVAGLISLLGTRIVTRKHPYYLMRRQKAHLEK